MTVRRLLAETGAAELSEWMAYERIAGPLGGRRGDIQAGIVAATVVNSQRARGAAARPDAFIPRWDRGRTMTPQEMWQAAMAANTAMGGTVRVRESSTTT